MHRRRTRWNKVDNGKRWVQDFPGWSVPNSIEQLEATGLLEYDCTAREAPTFRAGRRYARPDLRLIVEHADPSRRPPGRKRARCLAGEVLLLEAEAVDVVVRRYLLALTEGPAAPRPTQPPGEGA